MFSFTFTKKIIILHYIEPTLATRVTWRICIHVGCVGFIKAVTAWIYSLGFCPVSNAPKRRKVVNVTDIWVCVTQWHFRNKVDLLVKVGRGLYIPCAWYHFTHREKKKSRQTHRITNPSKQRNQENGRRRGTSHRLPHYWGLGWTAQEGKRDQETGIPQFQSQIFTGFFFFE